MEGSLGVQSMGTFTLIQHIPHDIRLATIAAIPSH